MKPKSKAKVFYFVVTYNAAGSVMSGISQRLIFLYFLK